MIVDWYILKNNQITLLLCFTFILETGTGLPIGMIFYFLLLPT